MSLSKEERLRGIHAEALAEFDNIQSALRDERRQCLQDRRFYSIAGAQWEGPLNDQFENKPKFEVNKVHLSVIRIINEYRNNRITVDFISKDGAEDDKLADTCDGLYRADEQDSCAEEAYDNAFEEAVGGGFGAWRLRCEYEDDEDPEDERQRIRIEPIFDADSSVFFDLNAKRQDKSDAKRCYVLTAMSPGAYKEEWGDDPASWPKIVHQSEFDWCTPDVVFIAEYYVVELLKETAYIWRDLDGEEKVYKDSDFKDDEDLRERLIAIGSREIRQKKIKCKKIRKYIMSGGKVLEDCGYLPGKCIPIVPMYGKRWFVDNVERCMGHVRLAKDAQRLKNMQLSKLGEISALSSIEKPIFTPEQMAGHQVMWAEDNIKNFPYLLVSPITDAAGQQVASGPIGYTKAPEIPAAMAALLQITETDMQDLLGNQQAGEQLQPNMSGKAVELIQNRLDMQTFIYMSNMAKAVKRSGEIWLSMAKDVLVEEGRKMKTVSYDGTTGSVEILRPVTGAQGFEIENDLSNASFDVAVDVGPSSSSKRAATVRALTGMMTITTDPETLQVLSAMVMMNMEGEGIEDVRGFFRKKLVSMGVVKPTEEEAKELAEAQANAKPDANTIYLQAAAQEAEANAVKARATTIKTLADADKSKAETIKTITETDQIEQQQALEVIERFQQGLPPAPDVTVIATDATPPAPPAL
ncbi:Phage P22-like portal protein [Pseudomonas sp. NFPP07]|uniref:portal protein n=1 Tax=Pseudomonas sp. NFPP07 TaxID=1566213 RepID=UPI0008EC2ABC|nr:portal protein [Pseudomonas sp. NFPP07]SFQ82515.1 Phage P22-like portal protein [Pseudomonas sp. NFPP07]